MTQPHDPLSNAAVKEMLFDKTTILCLISYLDYLDGMSINMKREDWSIKAFRLYKHHQGLFKKVSQTYKLGRLCLNLT